MSRSKLLALAAMFGAMSQSAFGCPPYQHMPMEKEKLHKCNTKKCKSCKLFGTYHSCSYPMQEACEKYVKRSKKRK